MRRSRAGALHWLALLTATFAMLSGPRPLFAQDDNATPNPSLQAAQIAAPGATPICDTVPGTGAITGKVTAQGSGDPVEADITVSTLFGNFVGAASTNASGEYTVTNVAAGQYVVEAEPDPGFGDEAIPTDLARQIYNGQSNVTDFTPVTVAEGQPTADIDFALTPGVVVQGRVTGAESGQGLGEVDVRFWRATTGFPDQAASATTDFNGFYTSTIGLSPGEYRIEFAPIAGLNDHAYVTTWYDEKRAGTPPDTVEISGAAPLIINQALSSEGLGAIAGTVTTADGGDPVDLALVRVFALDGDDIAFGYTFTGIYSVTVPAGDYKVLIIANGIGLGGDYVDQFVGGASAFAEAAMIEVGPGEVKPGNDVALSRGARVTGRVTDAGSGQGLGDISIGLAPTDPDPSGIFADGFATTDANGFYTTTAVPPGNYILSFAPFLNGSTCSYVREYFDNKPLRSEGTPITLAGTEVKTGFNANLVLGGNITGRATRADTGKGEAADVNVFNENDDSVASGFAEETGYYYTSAVPPGAYHVRFLPASDEFSEQWFNQKPSHEAADAVTVQAGVATTAIDAIFGGEVPGNQQLFTPLILK